VVTRRYLDQYYTPEWQTQALLANHRIEGRVLECCHGDAAITRVLQREPGVTEVVTNDIDPRVEAMHHLDATTHALYSAVGPVDWVVTNPPYEMPLCLHIVSQAVLYARVGVVMLFRISFREPTQLRGPFLEEHPPQRALTLPRYSYTGTGKTDSATTEWLIWSVDGQGYPALMSLYQAESRYRGRTEWQQNHPMIRVPQQHMGVLK
jgi:hypothetical protein